MSFYLNVTRLWQNKINTQMLSTSLSINYMEVII